MPRPDFVTGENLARWSENLDSDPNLPQDLIQSPIVREVCYAGLFLIEELEKLQCPESIIIRIQFTAGKLSFGRDAWDVHLKLLDDYKNNQLVFEEEPDGNSQTS